MANHYSGNFGRQFINGRQLTSTLMKANSTSEYNANATMPQNIGFTQYGVGTYKPGLDLSAYLASTNGSMTLHNYLNDTYSGVGAAGDPEIVFLDVLGYDAEPAVGNPSVAEVYTLSGYQIDGDINSVLMSTPKFTPRKIHGGIGRCVAYYIASSTFSSSPITTSAYDRGAAYATGGTAGGFVAVQWISADGTGTVTVDVKTSTSSGGTYTTAGSVSMTLSSFVGWGYVVIPSVANGGATLNRYVKTTFTLSASPQTSVTAAVHLRAFNP